MPEIFIQNVFLVQILNATVSILKFSYKMQENFLHTSVKCCTSAGKFPAHTVKIWIFLSSAGNMIPALQPPNTGALSHRLSFLISFGTCFERERERERGGRSTCEVLAHVKSLSPPPPSHVKSFSPPPPLL